MAAVVDFTNINTPILISVVVIACIIGIILAKLGWWLKTRPSRGFRKALKNQELMYEELIKHGKIYERRDDGLYLITPKVEVDDRGKQVLSMDYKRVDDIKKEIESKGGSGGIKKWKSSSNSKKSK